MVNRTAAVAAWGGRLAVVVVLAAAVGCPRRTGGDGDNTSSSSSSSSSSGASGSSSSGSSSGGSTSSSGALPLDALCAPMARGTGKLLTVVLLGFADDAYRNDCTMGFASEEEMVRFFLGDNQDLEAALCGGNLGLAPILASVSQAEQAGRLVYDEAAAQRCVTEGRAALAAAGGLFALQDGGIGGSQSAAAQAILDCQAAFRGTVPTNGVCAKSFECEQGDAGADCMVRTGTACEGTCRPLRGLGGACDGMEPECADPYVCVGGVCTTVAGLGMACTTDAGLSIPCEDGLRCTDGACEQRPALGQPCNTFSNTCGQGLRCVNDVCEPLGTEGQSCESSFFNSPCGPCLVCHDQGDGGATCRSHAGVGQSCADRPCHTSLYCSGATCIPLAGTGEACVVDPTTSDDMRGNCLSASEACLGSPSVCVRRVTAGETCQSAPLGTSTRGNCLATLDAELRCIRTLASDTNGTCQVAGMPGEVCGDTPQLNSECTNSSCRSGICTPSEGLAAGQNCTDNNQCAQTLYCNSGMCSPGGNVGQTCDNTAPWGSHCANGRCARDADGGNALVCQPYLGQGASCSSTNDCGTTLYCLNNAGTRTCQPRRVEGELCGSDSSACQDGLECSDGICLRPACVEDGGGAGVSGCDRPGTLGLLLLLGAVLVRPGRRRLLRRG